MIVALILPVLLISGFARAALLHTHPNVARECREVLVSNVRLIPSGREEIDWPQFQRAVHEYLRPGGIFEKLNISVPPQTLQFMPGADIDALVNNVGMPRAHWYHGQQITKARGRGIVYELIISGQTHHYGFYRDDNEFREQLSIVFHAAAGHNHFSHNTRFRHFRASDQIQEGIELSDYMDRMRIEVGGDEVSLWYQYLLSTSMAQDFSTAVYQTPAELKIKAPRKNKDGIFEKPAFQPTRNILQALVGNMSPEMPEWKREIARRFERLQRWMPGAAQTKKMNEGIAILMQFMMPKHGGHNSFEEGLDYCCLLHGVTRKDLSNPYYVGGEAAKNIYERFIARPEIVAMPTALEQDAAFMKYLTTEVISVMDDSMFLELGLDDAWITKKNLSLVRAWTKEEMVKARQAGMTLPKGNPAQPEANWPYSILTHNPADVRRALIAQSQFSSLLQPSPQITSLNEAGGGNVSLEIRDPIGKRVALNRASIAATLWVLAQIRESPVSLESTFDVIETVTVNPEYDGYLSAGPKTLELIRKVRVKVIVSPNGDLSAFEVERGGSSSPDSLPVSDLIFDPVKHRPTLKPRPELTEELKANLKDYLEILNLGKTLPDDIYQPSFQMRMVDETVQAVTTSPSVNLQLNVPTAARAVSEYHNAVATRLVDALRNAINGRGKMVRGANGVSLQALPPIPWLQFDQDSLNREIAVQPQRPLPLLNLVREGLNLTSGFSRPGDFDRIVEIPGREGDVVLGPLPPSPQEDKAASPGDEPTDDPSQEMMEEVSLKDYAEALASEIKLPNLRPKPGMDKRRDEKMAGRRQKPNGQPVNRAIQRNAYRRGLQEALGKQRAEEEGVDPHDTQAVIKRGISLLRRDVDWVVKGMKPKPAPNVNAVVFILLDTSGSMIPHHIVIKQALYDMRALLMRGYKNIQFKFVTANTKTFVYDTFEQFMKFAPNGGTSSAAGFRGVTALYPQYSASQYDRFVISAGDMDEQFTADVQEAFTEMKEGSRFTGVIKIHRQENELGAAMTNFFRQMAGQDEFVGYAEIIPHESYTPLMFKKLFKNED